MIIHVPNISTIKPLCRSFVEKRYKTVPIYIVIDSTGPDHSKIFEVKIVIVNKLNRNPAVAKARKKPKNKRRKKLGKYCKMKKTNRGGVKQSHRNPLIIPIFIMNSGCPHRCIFCNQKITAGNFPLKITKKFFDSEVKSYLAWSNR